MKPRARRMTSRRRWPLAALVAASLALAAVAADWWTCLPEGVQATYVGRESCAACHAQQVRDWTGSDHDWAMDLATDQTVLGDFDDQEFTYQGVTSRMFRRGEKFFVHTEGPTGKMEDFQIKYTFGVRPLQQYMVEFPDGRVQVLRVSWDTERKRWFDLPPPDVPDERLEPGDPLHWTGAAQNWNHTCADCHSTDLRKNYDLAANTYHTTWAEIDVSCEACHGPASLHVEQARSRSLFWDRRLGYGLARLKDKSSKTELDACARCHSRRQMIDPDFTAGSEFLDHYEPELLHAGLYYADGQILDEVYEYGSFLQSRMHRENVRCTDCHDPHTSRLKFEGNKLCSQCHQPGKYDSPAHHHHAVGSKGASCVECHMPTTTYMVVDPRRDHSLRVPRPDLTVELGTPNACNACHQKPDETAEWAAKKVVEWFGPKRATDPHYAHALAAGREGKPEGEQLLTAALKRRETPAIVKATAIELLGGYAGPESIAARRQALTDASPLVRAAAVRSTEPHSPGETLQLLAPRLSDPVRTVRIAAARRLAGVPRSLLIGEQREALAANLEEFERAQLASSDRAGAHLNLGNLYQELDRADEAIGSFETAIRLEPYLAGARSNLAGLYEEMGRSPKEIRRLREEELELLARDARLLPENAGVQHRLGLMLYLVGQIDEAEQALARACRLEPESYDFRLVLTLLYEKQKKWDEAAESVRELVRLRPNDPTTSALIQRIPGAANP